MHTVKIYFYRGNEKCAAKKLTYPKDLPHVLFSYPVYTVFLKSDSVCSKYGGSGLLNSIYAPFVG